MEIEDVKDIHQLKSVLYKNTVETLLQSIEKKAEEDPESAETGMNNQGNIFDKNQEKLHWRVTWKLVKSPMVFRHLTLQYREVISGSSLQLSSKILFTWAIFLVKSSKEHWV